MFKRIDGKIVHTKDLPSKLTLKEMHRAILVIRTLDGLPLTEINKILKETKKSYRKINCSPQYQKVRSTWIKTLNHPWPEIKKELVERTNRGNYLRHTLPCFAKINE